MLGETISHYQILDRLGRGGMGVIYRGVDTALKLWEQADPDLELVRALKTERAIFGG